MIRFSIPTRIFLGICAIVIAFGALSIGSVLQHRRNAQRLRVLEMQYLPLILRLSEAKAAQAIHVAQLERLRQSPESPALKVWLRASLGARPGTLRRVFSSLGALDEENVVAARTSLGRAQKHIDEILKYDKQHALTYERLFDGRSSPEHTRASDLESLITGEKQVSQQYRAAWQALTNTIAQTSVLLSDAESKTARWLIGLTLAAILFAIIVAIYARRLLEPLPILQQRVAQVASGDLSTFALSTRRDDEIGRLAAEFSKMVDALAVRDQQLRQSERLAAIGKMAAMVTHEVRNPLSSIGLNAELLADDIRPEDRGHELITSIQTEVDRLRTITDGYLRLARMPEPAFEKRDLVSLIKDTVSFIARELQEADVQVQERYPDTEVMAAIDGSQIRQALLNLMRNAREAMSEGGTLRVSVSQKVASAAQTSSAIDVAIEDSGSGIDIEDQHKVFETFFSTKTYGTGLGLSITQQIVVAHGGSLSYEPSELGGSCFKMMLPA